MRILRPTLPQILLTVWGLRHSKLLRWVHNWKVIKHPSTAYSQKRQLSLLEELFPEEIENRKSHHLENRNKTKFIPRLRLPNVDDIDRFCQDDRAVDLIQRDGMSRVAFMERDSLRQWNLAVLVLRQASRSLVERDFRRIIPKGQHIDDWKGPGYILKVFPARDLSTFQQLGSYFLIFPNPAYARAYQAHVVSLHRIARAHTPTSIESPIAPPQGMLLEGEDGYDLLQDYALCPPSQKISLRVLFPPFSPDVRLLLNKRGYSQIIWPDDKTSRAVLLWVTGYQSNLSSIRNMIGKDGQDRGLAWSLANGERSIEKVDIRVFPMERIDGLGLGEDADSSETKCLYPRWIISFVDENEARRFTRSWHRRPFPLHGEGVAVGEHHPRVYAEVIW